MLICRPGPVSFIVANHVKEGRSEMNFSLWKTFSEKRKSKKLKELVEKAHEKGKPADPPWNRSPTGEKRCHIFSRSGKGDACQNNDQGKD